MNFIDRSFWSHEEADRAKRFAKNRQLPDAINIAKNILTVWSDSPSFLERQMRKVSINGLLADLKNQIKTWETQVEKAEYLAKKAREAFEANNPDPWDTEALEKALSLYQESLALMEEMNWKTHETICQHKLKQKRNFQRFYQEGKEQAAAKYYKKAIRKLEQAQSLFSHTELTKEIIICRQQLGKQHQYERVYETAKDLTQKGDFYSAIAHFKPAYTNFPREDGKIFLQKLEAVIAGKQAYKQGLIAEKLENWDDAKAYYFQARKQLPHLGESCSMRLAMIAIKTQQWSEALQELNFLEGEKAHYLRGYVYIQTEDYQAVRREWKSLSHPQLKGELEKLKVLIKREKLAFMQEIEMALERDKIEQAEALSQAFLKQFGADPIVERNLTEHIEPRLANLAWKTHNWQELAQETETLFVQQKDMISLHNWAIATYYQAQVYPEKMEEWITAWCSAIANLKQDPTLKEISWLGSNTPDFQQIQKDLNNLLANAIDEKKEKNLDQYFILRDQYRADVAALESSLTVNDLNILPSCYQRHQKYFPKPKLTADDKGALYTQWGKAVAACLSGDTKRSFQLTPRVTSKTPAEEYGEMYVAYHQGIFYLQNEEWRQAKSPLKLAQKMILKNPEWKQEIDDRCEQIIGKLSDHEAASLINFWYDLLDSAAARRYYVEQKADQIRESLADQKISTDQGKKELGKLQKIDGENPVVLELLKAIQRLEEAQEVSRLLDIPDLESAVKRARSCQDERVKYMVAEICIDILLEGIKNNSLYREDIMKLARWAYSLCPNEPNFMSIYQQLLISH